MATIGSLARSDIHPKNPLLSISKTTIESAFYGNNVSLVPSLTQAYRLAVQSPEQLSHRFIGVFVPRKLGLSRKPRYCCLMTGKSLDAVLQPEES